MAPNGFLLAASSLGFPPRPLKNTPPAEEPDVLAELEPNSPPPDGCCCPNTLPPLGCWPNTEVVEELPKAEGCPKLNPVDEVVIVLLPNTDPCPNPELCCPNAGVALCPNNPMPELLAVLALLVPKENELALLAVEAPNRLPLPPVVELLELAPNAGWPKEKPLDVPVLLLG